MTLETTRNISIVWLSLFCFIGLLPPVVLLYFAVRGMNWVHNSSVPLFQRARKGSDLVKEKTNEYSNLAASPLITLKQRFHRWQKTVESLKPKQKSTNSQGE